MNAARWAPWAAAVVDVQVGAAIVATCGIVGELGPAPPACLRCLPALSCLLPFAWSPRASARISRCDLPMALLLVAGGVAVAQEPRP